MRAEKDEKFNHFSNTKRSDIGQRLGPLKMTEKSSTNYQKLHFVVHLSLCVFFKFPHFHYSFHFPSPSLPWQWNKKHKNVNFRLKIHHILFMTGKVWNNIRTYVKMIIFRVALKWENSYKIFNFSFSFFFFFYSGGKLTTNQNTRNINKNWEEKF